MPTVVTHAAVPLALGIGLGRAIISRSLLVTGIIFSILPDFDGIGFWRGIAYGSTIGHRGLTHSIIFAAGLTVFGTCFSRLFRSSYRSTFLFLLACTLSHALLDALTNGGLGVAFWWPWEAKRYFLPWRVIEVSPLYPTQFLSRRGMVVILSELKWVWMPCFGVGCMLWLFRQLVRKR